MNLPELCIRRPVMTTLLMAAFVIFGIIAYRALPVSELPSVDFPTISVTAALPGASPETMAAAVATPLEGQFSTIAGLDSMNSTSAQGTTSITLQFSLERNIDDAAQDALARTAVDHFGRITIWVNNAGGASERTALHEMNREQWDRCLALNLTAVWAGIVVAARHIDTGCIINISSGAGTGPVPGSGHYGAAKAGVNSLTQTAAAELAPRIRVNGIMPGAIPTEIFRTALGIRTDDDLAEAEARWDIPMGRFGRPLDIGAAAVYLASPAASWVTGETIRVAGGARPRGTK